MIAVIVVTYNAKPYLTDLLTSLAQTEYRGAWKLFIVDNASTDGTAHAVQIFGKLNFPTEVQLPHIIVNSENLGFAEGNNVGIRAALDEGAEFVVLLNHDTVVDPHWLTHLHVAMESDATIGAAQVRLMLWPEKEKVNSIGNEIHYLGFGYSGGYREYVNISTFKYSNILEIAYASGAAVMYRASTLRAVGLLDESLFMYHDDLDLGWRLWMTGWRSILAPDAIVYHKYEFSRSIKKYYLMERNRFLVLFELYRIPTLLLIAPALIVMECGLLLKAFVSGWGREKLRAYAFFFKPSTWHLVWKKRKEKQSLRRVTDRVVTRHFVGKIEFQEFASPLVRYVMNPAFNLYWYIVRNIIVW